MQRITKVGRLLSLAFAALGGALTFAACGSGGAGGGGAGGSTSHGTCGDGQCNSGESCEICPGDCGACPNLCGNGTCEAGETCAGCPGDCGECCGNGTCEADFGEDCDKCPSDCGTCCGNGTCEAARGETCDTCSEDCGDCCGNGKCEAKYGESCGSCSKDCGQCCGNGKCDTAHGESCSTCPDECAGCCGDGYCSPFEDWSDCWADCWGGAPILQIELGKCTASFIGDALGADYLWVRSDNLELMYNADDNANPIRLFPYPNTPYVYAGNNPGGSAQFTVDGNAVNLGVKCAKNNQNQCLVFLYSQVGNQYEDAYLTGTGYTISDWGPISACP